MYEVYTDLRWELSWAYLQNEVYEEILSYPMGSLWMENIRRNRQYV